MPNGFVSFQSTHPRGVRPYHNYSHSLYCPFQSTHPVWGATCVYARPPRSHEQFQSTHPVWGATDVSILVVGMIADFNPRTPYGVRLPAVEVQPLVLDISIQAPRMGCDSTRRCSRFCLPDFNPRTPYGVRLCVIKDQIDTEAFQSTHPVWGATGNGDAAFAGNDISIHAPRMGCDRGAYTYGQLTIISIHAPRMGCDLEQLR